MNAAAPEVLTTIGAGGLVVESSSVGISLGSNVRLSADQVWGTAGTGNGAGIGHLSTFKENNEGFFDFGGRTVVKNGPATVSFGTDTSGHCTLSNGTLVMNAGELSISSALQAPGRPRW